MSHAFHDGWDKARGAGGARGTILIKDQTGGSIPNKDTGGSDPIDWPVILGGWNNLARWEIFRLARPGETPDVYVSYEPSLQGSAYAGKVYIQLRDYHPRLVQHELGHVLGYGDHFAGDGSYRGVMAYDWMYDDQWAFGGQDATMLERESYRAPAPAPVPPPPPNPAPKPTPAPQPQLQPATRTGLLSWLLSLLRRRR